VIADNEDPWRMDTNEFREVTGRFVPLDEQQGSTFSGVKEPLPSVRVIEDGEVRTVIEAVLHYNHSYICQTYKLPKKGTEVEIHVRVYWNEKDKMLKLSIPTGLAGGRYRGQTAFGINELAETGEETIAQKWVAVQSPERGQMLSIINDGVYGSDYRNGEIRLSLLRGAGYCAHPIGDRPIMPQDRFQPRMDQGERCYSFWLNAGAIEDRTRKVDREATVHNERPHALSFFSSGEGDAPGTVIELTDEAVQLSAFKKGQSGEGYIIRLFEPTGQARVTLLNLPLLGISSEVRLNGFEIATLRIDPNSRMITQVSICEDSKPFGGMNDHGQN